MKRGIIICLALTCLFTITLNQNLRGEDIEDFEVYKDLVFLGATDEILEYYKAIELLTDYMGSLTDLLYLPENFDKYFDMENKFHDIDAIIQLSSNQKLIKHNLNPKIGEILQNSARYLNDIVKDLISNLKEHNLFLDKSNSFNLPPLPSTSIKALSYKEFAPSVSDYIDFSIKIDFF